MFKNLREKIAVSDSNTKSAPGEHSLSRFSSISSLVSDVGSAFSKALTNPQHVQPTTRNSNSFYDLDSASEYDDSVVQGDVMNKEELFQRYQRAQSLAKRYKTRSLEMVECYKQLEHENVKLIQTLTESQDCSIRRVGELREQIELDKKAKNDIEENYQLIIDEKGELINVLRLQISLLKEGKDLPTELESQIKEKHDMEIQIQKRKDDEIKELRATMSQRENLLQRCKEKITSLNTQLSEIKMKYDSISNTLICGDSSGEQFSTDLAKLSCQHAESLENIQDDHSERMRNMLCEFEFKKAILEKELHEEYEQKISTMKQELKELNEKMTRMSLDSERLEEQVNIKTNIIENLMSSQDERTRDMDKAITTVDQSSCFEILNESFNQEIDMSNDHVDVEDFKNQIKFLQGRIEQMEALKTQTEEETGRTEDDLKNLELTLKKEKDDCENKCNLYKSALDEMTSELNSNASKCETLSLDVSNLNSALANKKVELNDLLQNQRQFEIRCESLEMELKKTEEVNSNLKLQIDSMFTDNGELEKQLQIIREDYENDQRKSRDQSTIYKNLQDKCDELNSIIEKEMHEKEKLLALLNGSERTVESPLNKDDGLMLKIVEMRQIYDQQIEEGNQQIRNMNIMLSEKNVLLHELEIKIEDLSKENDKMSLDLKNMEILKEEISKQFSTVKEELEKYISKIENVEIEKELILKNQNDEMKSMEEKENLIVNLKKENEELVSEKSKFVDLTMEQEKLRDTMTSINSGLTVELEQIRLRNQDCVNEKEILDKECSIKDEQLRVMTEEVQLIRNSLSETNMLKDKLTNENRELQTKIVELIKEFDTFKEKSSSLEQDQMDYSKLDSDYIQCKKDVSLFQSKFDEATVCNLSLQKAKEDVEKEIARLEESLKIAEEKVTISVKATGFLEEKINIFVKYLNIFQSWNDEVVSMFDCGNQCNLNGTLRTEYWNIDLENGCDSIEEISLIGRSIDRVLLSWHTCHRQLHQKISENDINDDNFLNGVRDFCVSFDGESELRNNEEILQRLSLIRADIDKRNDQIRSLEQAFESDDWTTDESYDEKSGLCLLKRKIVNTVRDYRSKLQEKEIDIDELKGERGVILKKIEKMTKERVQHFKVLSKIFELTDLDHEDKSLSKIIMKDLREYAKKSVSLSVELNSVLTKLKDMELQLNTSVEECQAKEMKITELTELISQDTSKIFTMRQELDKSLNKLNELSDEKGQIDEEKGSLRKELKEVHEKIQALKLDSKRLISDKENLEKSFNESLEKVKLNHLILEENYNKEIEKQSGYRHYLEEQISANCEETSRQITANVHASNVKLEEVLKQSEQLLVLNHQYKDLFEKSKTETNVALESLKQSEVKLESVECVLQELRGKNASLSKTVDDLTETLQQVHFERDNLKVQFQSLIVEKEKSVETLVNLQSSSKDVEIEKLNFLDHIKDLKTKNHVNEEELRENRELFEKLTIEYDHAKKENCKLVQQLADERTNLDALKCAIEEKQTELQSQKTKMESLKTKFKKMNTDHETEISEIKQQFIDNKSTTDDDHNYRVKKIAKEFNEKMLVKEQDFQKTFQEALENVRKEEARQKSDLKDEIDTLNGMVIELETEKNGLFNTISDLEDDVKKSNSLLQTKELQLKALIDEISDYKSTIAEYEQELSKMKTLEDTVGQQSKINQAVNTSSYYEDSSWDTVNANDHDILRMHCTDLEEQVRQLHLENIKLKRKSVSTPPVSHEPIISATKSHALTSQPSFDNVSLKSVNIINAGGSFRSPNTSCSEYQFCPYPITEATEYEYLRDILVKYMTGLETNTLARVVCTVMRFTRDETDRIVRFEQDKRKLLQIQLFS